MRHLILTLALVLLPFGLIAQAEEAPPTAPVIEIEIPVVQDWPVVCESCMRVFCEQVDGSWQAGTAFATVDGVYTAFHVIAPYPVSIRVVLPTGVLIEAVAAFRVYGEDIVGRDLTLPEGYPLLEIAECGLTEPTPVMAAGYWGDSIDLGSQVASLGLVCPDWGVSSYFDTHGTTYYGSTLMAGPGLSGCPILGPGGVVGLMTGISGGRTVISRLDRAHLARRASLGAIEAALEGPLPAPEGEKANAEPWHPKAPKEAAVRPRGTKRLPLRGSLVR